MKKAIEFLLIATILFGGATYMLVSLETRFAEEDRV